MPEGERPWFTREIALFALAALLLALSVAFLVAPEVGTERPTAAVPAATPGVAVRAPLQPRLVGPARPPGPAPDGARTATVPGVPAVPGAAGPPTARAAGCPEEAVRPDDPLVRLKTRALAPARYEELTVETFLERFTPRLPRARSRGALPAAARQAIEANEARGVALVGHLVGATESAPRAGGCPDPAEPRVLLRVSGRPPDSRAGAKALAAEAVVAAVTPLWQARNAGWRPAALRRLAREGARVRLSGWPMYDPSHPAQVGRTRATLWEIHPVTRIDVWRGERWEPVD
jgi:hypothetical protein